ncbi:hypothetical protein ACIQWI_24195 [Peribacillus frigoritolerans]
MSLCHYGEVFGTWAFLTITKGLIACHQTILNHTGDKDLHKLLVEVINQVFAQFHSNKAALGADFLRLNNEKGWLIPPPLHINKTSM